MADGISRTRITRERQSLTAATAEILKPPRTTGARLLHPVRAPEGIEGRCGLPDVGKRMISHGPELEARDGLGCMAGQNLAGRRDIERPAPPSAHAGFGVACEIVR